MTNYFLSARLKSQKFFLTKKNGGSTMIGLLNLLEMFFLIYLDRIKYPGQIRLIREVFDRFSDELTEIYIDIVNGKTTEAFGVFDDLSLRFGRQGRELTLKLELPSNLAAIIYAHELRRIATSEELVNQSFDPNGLRDAQKQIHYLFRKKNVSWQLVEKAIEIKIGDE